MKRPQQGKCSRIPPSTDLESKRENLVTRRGVLKLAGAALALNIIPQVINGGPAQAETKENKAMKIVLLTGSPHANGTSALLADEFAAGAASKGHTVVRFNAAFEQISPCKGCYFCKKNNGTCIQKDSMSRILPEIIAADMLVLVTPIYYFGMSSQLKMALDRCFAGYSELKSHPMKSALLATCGADASWSMDALVAHYQSLCRYHSWEDKGHVLALGVLTRKDIETTTYPAEARSFGESV